MSLSPQYIYNIDRIRHMKQYPKESNIYFNTLLITKNELYKKIILKLNKKCNKDNLRIRIFNLLLLKHIREITDKINLKPCYVCSSILSISMYSKRQLKNGALRKCPPCAQNAIHNSSHKNEHIF